MDFESQTVKEASGIPSGVTIDRLAVLIKNDSRVQVAGVDGDGQLRGKVMAKEKFLSVINSGFGMSSAIFDWDMHDQLFEQAGSSTSFKPGYADIIGVPDRDSMRRLLWAGDMPFFLPSSIQEE
ncbi:hypothetical protein PENFLA_c081G05724 [Penicillium flavigenum]|uniref:Uncharacterized protein n=1 Tax=Penicillium flavigenum TaxID=254877 RepID=A0A1V6S9Y9_9EURO|nr:hypothetical protein PENFLA_c081G05724 [Penicillium flavigenum]